jgi:type I restriction enzyme S subunit
MNLLKKHFDLAFAAPDGIQKLRKLILTLAMQGKLVPQDPGDQPASELLKAIEAEKHRLVKEGKIKQPKPSPEIKPDEVPYDLPKSWKWCRWNDVALKIGDVDHKMPAEVTDGVPYVSPRDFFGKNEIAFSQAKKISIQDFETLKLKIQPEKFDIIFPRYGTLGVNRFVLVDIDFLASYSCAVIKNLEGFVDPKYSYYYSISKLVRTEIERYTKKTTQANVGVQSIQIFLYPLPPLAEQRRIVAKIDRLMARCDELEKLRAERNQKRITIHTAALNRLLTAKESDDFSTAWRFITQHFGELYSVKENVAELRKAILQLAVMGKLVPQDPNDEPASELLRAIELEKQRLVKERKIKQPKPLSEIKPEEVPYELPKGWTWVRLGYIGEFINGDRGKNYPNRDEYVREGVPWINTGHIEPNGSLTQTEMNFITREKFNSLNSGKIEPGDLVYCLRGATFGKTAIVNPYKEGAIASSLMIIRPFAPCSNRYLYRYLVSPVGRSQIFKFDNGSAQPNLSANSVRLYVYPLPPSTEQDRIVAKIDQLMALCDQLDNQIDAATSKQTTLLNAVMAQV